MTTFDDMPDDIKAKIMIHRGNKLAYRAPSKTMNFKVNFSYVQRGKFRYYVTPLTRERFRNVKKFWSDQI